MNVCHYNLTSTVIIVTIMMETTFVTVQKDLPLVQIFILVLVWKYRNQSTDYFYVIIDVDECTKGTAACTNGRVCNNTVGSYQCICPLGTLESNGTCNGKQYMQSVAVMCLSQISMNVLLVVIVVVTSVSILKDHITVLVHKQ